MLNVERLDYIISEIKKTKAVYVDQLAAKLYVSPSTIRRDLDILEKEGMLRRSYGGAVIFDQVNNETPFAIRESLNHFAKDTIGMIAAQLVKDEMILSMDSSSTASCIVKHLTQKNNLRVITTSANTGLSCLDTLNAKVYCPGGWLNPYSRSFVGESSRQFIAGFNTDLFFFSSRAISLEHGITDISEEELPLRQWMMKKSKKTVFLCDSTKFDQVSLISICDIECLDYLITEKKPDARWMSALTDAKVNVIYPGVKI